MNDEAPTLEQTEAKVSGRLVSLDALRGFDMFFIAGGLQIIQKIFVLCGVDKTHVLYLHTKHQPWEGFHAWDLVMPLFLFMVGAAMPFSFNKRLGSGDSKAKLYGHIFKRVVILVILGMVVQGKLLDLKWANIRFYSNTLQAIAAGYLIASVAMLHLKVRGQAITCGCLMLGYFLLMKYVPAPGLAAGMFEPDQNLAIYIDNLILGSHGDGSTYAWILSSITFGATTLIGVLAGHWLRTPRKEYEKFAGLFVAGIVLIAAGWIWGKWNFPLIKKLWTSSMVLYAGGWSLILLALFYLVIDVWKFQAWAFGFKVIGMNAIFVYVSWHVLGGYKFYTRVFDSVFHGFYQWTGDWTPLIKTSGAFMVSWLVLLWMYRKKTFVKI